MTYLALGVAGDTDETCRCYYYSPLLQEQCSNRRLYCLVLPEARVVALMMLMKALSPLLLKASTSFLSLIAFP